MYDVCRLFGLLLAPAILVACSAENGGASSSGVMPVADGGATPSACEVTGAIPDPLPLKVTVVATSSKGSAVVVPGAAVEVRAIADDAVLGKGSTSLEGIADLSLVSRGAPVMAYVRVTRSGFLSARYAYQTGFVGGVTGDITAFLPTASELSSQAGAAGKTFDPKTTSAVGITAYDCTSKLRLAGATFQVTPGTGVVYRDSYGDYAPNAMTSTEVGSATDFGVAAGRAKVTVSKSGRSSEMDVPIGTGELFGVIMSL